MINNESTNWFYSRSRAKGSFKKLKGFEAWFYTGPSKIKGHAQSKKSKK